MMRLEAKAVVAAGEPMGVAPERGERVEWGCRVRPARLRPALPLAPFSPSARLSGGTRAIDALSSGVRRVPFIRLRRPGPEVDHLDGHGGLLLAAAVTPFKGVTSP